MDWRLKKARAWLFIGRYRQKIGWKMKGGAFNVKSFKFSPLLTHPWKGFWKGKSHLPTWARDDINSADLFPKIQKALVAYVLRQMRHAK